MSFLMLLLVPLNVISTSIACRGLILNTVCLVSFFAYRFFIVPESNYRKLCHVLNTSLIVMLLLAFSNRLSM
jgi:hypothetical protein